MERDSFFTRPQTRREALANLTRLGLGGGMLSTVGASALALAGCGGSKHDDPPITVSRTGRFVNTDSQAIIGNKIISLGRTYVVLNNGIPTEIGWLMPETLVHALPKTAFDVPGIYYLALPPDVTNTPFKFVAFSDWQNGHNPVGIGDAPHIHPLFVIGPPLQPSAGLATEQIHIANPDEIPAGYVPGDSIPGVGITLAPGIGMAYEYPTAPQLQPGWNTTAQNYFVYNGHVNGIGMGASYEFLNAKKSATLPIAQPKVYPRPGWYPTKNVTTWDEGTKSHVFALTDFVQAERFL